MSVTDAMSNRDAMEFDPSSVADERAAAVIRRLQGMIGTSVTGVRVISPSLGVPLLGECRRAARFPEVMRVRIRFGSGETFDFRGVPEPVEGLLDG